MMIFVLSAMLVLSFVIDIYVIFLRFARQSKLAEFMSAANLVQYVSRIINMLVIFTITIYYEKGADVNPVFIFSTSCFISVFVILIMIRKKVFFKLFGKFFIGFILIKTFPSIKNISVWKDIEIRKKISFKVAFSSFVVNTAILLAMFVPFGVANSYPEYRMTAVYFGQIVNFSSTLMNFALLDPLLVRELRSGKVFSMLGGQIMGRIFSYFFIGLIFGIDLV